jgi:flagellar motor switch protein FliG
VSKLSDIQGHQRVAALLLGLEEDVRAAIIAKLKPDVVEVVAAAMLELDPKLTELGVVEELKDDLAVALHGHKSVRPCARGDLHEFLAKGLGRARGDAVMEDILRRRREQAPFHALEEHDPFELGRVLREESAAVCALVMAHLAPGTSAQVLRVFDQEAAIEVVKRMATIESPSLAVLQGVADHLAEALAAAPPTVGAQDPGERLRAVADLLNQSTPEMEKGVIESLTNEDAEMAQELREYMFTWEDIATIDTRTMQKILGTVDTKTLSVALKGCSSEVEDNILGNLSARVREMVAEERELVGALPLSEVKGARNDIMKNIRAMIEAGEFRPSRGGDDLVA